MLTLQIDRSGTEPSLVSSEAATVLAQFLEESEREPITRPMPPPASTPAPVAAASQRLFTLD